MKFRKLYLAPIGFYCVVIAVAVAEQRHRGDAIIDSLPADGSPSEYWGNIGFFLMVILIIVEYVLVIVRQREHHKSQVPPKSKSTTEQ